MKSQKLQVGPPVGSFPVGTWILGKRTSAEVKEKDERKDDRQKSLAELGTIFAQKSKTRKCDYA